MNVFELGRNLLIGDSMIWQEKPTARGAVACPVSKRSINNDCTKAFETTRPRPHAKNR